VQGFVLQHDAHELRIVVIARDAVDGHAEGGEALAQALVARARTVVHEIAGEQDAVGRPGVTLCAVEHAIERALRYDAAQRGSLAREQVRVGDVQDAWRSHDLVTIVPATRQVNKRGAGASIVRAAWLGPPSAATLARMSSRTLRLDDTLYDYLCATSLREPLVMQRLREVTASLDEAGMQISPEQGQFMALLARLIGARRYLEIGVFTGYSSLAVALALPEDGRVIACDINPQWTRIAQRYWHEAGVAHKIDLRLARAADSLRALEAEGWAGQIDMVFIDADKRGYPGYYEQSLLLLRRGGLLLVDNTLWGGNVADPGDQSEDTQAIRRFNAALHTDERVDLSLIPLGDGLTLARKRVMRGGK
jgi:predicted O-methyltransferase YrrM